MTDQRPVVQSDPARGHAGVFLFGLALVAVFLAWMPSSYSMVRRWMGAQGYYSHGILVPLITAYLIWMRRDLLRAAPIRRGWWGLVLLIAGGLGQLASAYANVAFSSGFSLILVLMGLVWIVYGGRVFRLVAFPLAFLGFMVPLYQELLEQMSYPMKTGAAEISTRVMRDLLGVGCDRIGNMLYFAHDQLEVGDPCSGLRSLIALMALGALVASMAKVAWWRRALLFLASIPFALAGNVARITTLGLVTDRWNSKVALGDVVHYGAGFLVFFVAVGLLLGLWRILRIGRGAGVPPATDAGKMPAPRAAAPAPWPDPLRRAAVVLLLLASVKALVSLFALEEVQQKYVTRERVALTTNVDVATITDRAFTDYMETLRFQRVTRATIDVNYVFFTLIGLVFLLRGLRGARWYLIGLAGAGLAADAGFVVWLFRVEHLAVPAASVGLEALLVSLHLVVYAGLSAMSLIWTIVRLNTASLRGALGRAAPSERQALWFAPRAAFGAVAMLLLAALTWWLLRPAPADASLLRAGNVPLVIGAWEGRNFEPEPSVYETLETRDILSRYYRHAGTGLQIELSVVFSQQNRRATHPPEICFKGSGWETQERRRVVLPVSRGPGQPNTPFVELVSKHQTNPSLLLTFYTFKAGTLYTNDYLRQQAQVFLMNLKGRPARGALVRFSAYYLPANERAANLALLDFMQTAMPLIEASLEGTVP